jgi:MOSC domain-containing protein YiiM|tara:strand:- start:273 stop:746 length:474 start_codon:yes stop_codon:yes gene_type:complete
MANIEHINVNLYGGVPKYSVPCAKILTEGVEGDKQISSNHGGENRAVLLYSMERIEELQQAKHPITPGSTGENLTIRGLDWSCLKEGVLLQIGEVKLQLTGMASPCPGIKDSFFDFAWSVCRDRWCTRVITEGMVNVGDEVSLLGAYSRLVVDEEWW